MQLRPTTGAIAALVAALLLYLLFWPVDLEPIAWNAPVDEGLVDPFAANDRLRRARLIDIGAHEGPEDLVAGPGGLIYTGTRDGKVLRLGRQGNNVEVFADAGGRILGLDADAAGNLVAANAYLGLQRISPSGEVSILVNEFDGVKLRYANDVAVAADGKIYFSDSSVKFGTELAGGTHEASVLDILEHGGHGRILRHDPSSGETSLVVDGLNFANGVAISDNQQYLVIAETGSYRILRFWLIGENAGKLEVIIDNLPGFPDNVNNGLNDRFWIGLVAPRIGVLDRLADKPWLRKVVQRLPDRLKPAAVPSSHVIAITGDGVVLMNLQDTSVRLPAITGAFETPATIWLSSLFGNRIGRLDKRLLAD